VTWTDLALGTVLPLVIAIIGTVGPSTRFGHRVYGEFGILENLTVILLVPTALLGAAMLWTLTRRRDPEDRPRRWLRLGLALAFAVGATYFAGEEISWGQHFLGFGTPESYVAWNYQGETNLHNSSDSRLELIFHEGPKLLLSWACPLSGFVFPLLLLGLRIEPRPEDLTYWVSHDFRLAVAGLAVPAITLFKRAGEFFHGQTYYYADAMGLNTGEIKECLVAAYLFGFAIQLYRKHRENPAATA
jgi:hypothetical protein